MKEKDRKEKEHEKSLPRGSFARERNDCQKWAPVFQRLGLRTRRFIPDNNAILVCAAEGWFRLSLLRYKKEELNWIRTVLAYLEERSFANWAVSWRKTIIWEENDSCYLIQPWLVGYDCFHRDDPAAVERVAEILAEFYRCGKDYRENKGIEIVRDRWSAMGAQWKEEMKLLQCLDENRFHERIRKELHMIRKEAEEALNECLTIWETGMNSLLEHHRHLGVLGHGAFLTRHILWRENDYQLLNWENLAFLPKIVDLASLIRDAGNWEPEWIIYLIKQYSRLQPLWPEEYHALKVLLEYPQERMDLLRREQPEEIDHKLWKEGEKMLRRKGRCLDKVWREFSSEKTKWTWGRENSSHHRSGSGKLSMVLSPVEDWGGFCPDQEDTIIHVKHEQKLPDDIWQRLVSLEPDRVLGGRENVILEASSPIKEDAPKPREEMEDTVEAITPSETETDVESCLPLQSENSEESTDDAEIANEPVDSSHINEQAAVEPPKAKETVLLWKDFSTAMKRRKS